MYEGFRHLDEYSDESQYNNAIEEELYFMKFEDDHTEGGEGVVERP